MPSKNFIAIVGSFVVILFTAWFAFSVIPGYKLSTTNHKPSEGRSLSLSEAYQQADLDTDGDGLKDWEEILWGTDPRNADTDGDGYVDGREISQGRDPLAAGEELAGGKWSDALKKPEEIVKQNPEEIQQTFSEKVAVDFASKYFTGVGIMRGQPLPQEFKNFLAEDVITQLRKGAASYADEFALKDIKTFISPPGGEQAAARAYLNELGIALENNFKDTPENGTEFVDSLTALSIKEQEDIIISFETAYKNTAAFLKIQNIPKPYASLHLTLINSMNNTATAFETMRKIERDPLVGFIGVQLFYKELARSREYLTALKQQVLRDNLVFNQNEGGAFFDQYFAQI